MPLVYDQLLLKNQLCFPLYLCEKALTRRYGAWLKPLGLTYTQYVVMMYFWEHRQANMSELGRAVRLDSGTLTPLVRKLEKKGYLKREAATADGRYLKISLTERGQHLSEQAQQIPSQIGSCLGLDADEAETLYGLLYKVLNNIEEQNNDY